MIAGINNVKPLIEISIRGFCYVFIVKSIITFTLARLGRNQRYESWRMPKAHSSLGIRRLASGDGVGFVVH